MTLFIREMLEYMLYGETPQSGTVYTLRTIELRDNNPSRGLIDIVNTAEQLDSVQRYLDSVVVCLANERGDPIAASFLYDATDAAKLAEAIAHLLADGEGEIAFQQRDGFLIEQACVELQGLIRVDLVRGRIQPVAFDESRIDRMAKKLHPYMGK